ncbi:hypothetical protein Vadar_006762 [Vaccinium darrowii]|uniref:Uncharacterized protein n=1 Tax=Vaccinium darrowii TaxID=229202 RepID=A0ACB7YTP5_9ERIC|nr:hypothetical protein Vadar_006762 [Vaccinium darrowii]
MIVMGTRDQIERVELLINRVIAEKSMRQLAGQVGENEPLYDLLTRLPATIADLEPHQIAGYMMQAESDPEKRLQYLQMLMKLPNGGRRHAEFLKRIRDVIRTILNIFQINTSVASSLRIYFVPQISLIFFNMLDVYRMYSELISTSIVEGDPDPFCAINDESCTWYKDAMIDDVPLIFEAVFQCTLETHFINLGSSCMSQFYSTFFVGPYKNNISFVHKYTQELVSASFPNKTATEVAQFATKLQMSSQHRMDNKYLYV